MKRERVYKTQIGSIPKIVNNKLIIPTPADDNNATELSSPASEKTRGAK